MISFYIKWESKSAEKDNLGKYEISASVLWNVIINLKSLYSAIIALIISGNTYCEEDEAIGGPDFVSH